MNIVAEVKIRLNILESDTSNDLLLASYINQVNQKIINYCNRTVLPEKLEYTVVDIVCDMYNNSKNGSYVGQVISDQQGDRAIQYSNQNAITGAGGGDFIKNYLQDIKPFRRMKAK